MATKKIEPKKTTAAPTGLSAEIKQQLADLGIVAKTEADARLKLIKFLNDQDVESIEDDPLKDLLEMANALATTAGIEEEEAEEEVEETEEVEEEVEEVEETEEAEEEEVEEEFEEEEVEEEFEEEAEMDELAEEVSAEEEEETLEESVSAPVKKKSTERVGGTAFNSYDNPEHKQLLKIFLKVFPAATYSMGYLKRGFTIRMVNKNTQPTIANFDEIKVLEGDKLVGNLYLNRFKSVEELMPFLPAKYHDREIGMFRAETHPCIRSVKSSELIEIMNAGVLEESVKKANTMDKRMSANRQRLEESLTKTSKPAVAAPKPAAAPVAKKVIPVVPATPAKKTVIVSSNKGAALVVPSNLKPKTLPPTPSAAASKVAIKKPVVKK